jgi:hypothetical protein
MGRGGRRRLAIPRAALASVAALACSVALAGAGTAAAATRRAGTGHRVVTAERRAGGWANAQAIRGIGTLNTAGYAGINVMSCVSRGNCTAAGFYANGAGDQVFVVSERNGTWGNAAPVPGLGALNTGGDADVTSLSCAALGYCALGGDYITGPLQYHAYVASERHGRWSNAIQVPGTASTKPVAAVNTIACPSVSYCIAGGVTAVPGRPGLQKPFVVVQTRGRWGTAIAIPGIRRLGQLIAGVESLSCVSAGNCTAGGLYADDAGHYQAFVAAERNDRWSDAIEVPGTARLNRGGFGGTDALSCAAVGNCVADGHYKDGSGRTEVFVVSERNGRWGKAAEIPGTASLNRGGAAIAGAVSCASIRYCAIVGSYSDGLGHTDAYVVNIRYGRSGTAVEIPGTSALNAGGYADSRNVSCDSAADCAAGGIYTDDGGHDQAFVVGGRGGRWTKALEVPGTGALNIDGNGSTSAVSCTGGGYCAAGGFYADASGDLEPFVASRS